MKVPKKAEKEFWDSNPNPSITEFIKFMSKEPHPRNKQCTKPKCSSNPSCLNRIIPTLEFLDLEINPIPLGPVGIKNLGATCYLNSLLQIWFRNLEFRRIIYEYKGQNPLVFIIQKAFGRFELGIEVVDLLPLVESLELSKVIQQDALEFAKLLISKLDQILAKDHEKLSQLHQVNMNEKISQQYEGGLVNVIRCDVCSYESHVPTKFTELSLNFTDKMTLEESLSNFLSFELLMNENKYQCQRCNKKVNATRCSKITFLPKTLNIVINRFMFDLKTMRKQKVHLKVLFPEKINMGQYFQNDTNSIYDLSAVLIHKGPNANEGHYISRVFDQELGLWLDCDDEVVSKMDSPYFDLKNVDGMKNNSETEGKIKKGKGKEVPWKCVGKEVGGKVVGRDGDGKKVKGKKEVVE
jgi:ubiquitin carboxyl-terminal hydrolase 48